MITTNIKKIHSNDEYLNDPKQHWQSGMSKTETIECLEQTKEFVDRAYSVFHKFLNDENFQSMILEQDSGQEIFKAMIEGIMSHESRPDVLDALANKMKMDHN